MKKYYQNDKISLYNGDSKQILSQLNLKVNAVVTDPPYAINFENNKWDKSNFDIYPYINLINDIVEQNGNILMFQGWSNVTQTINKFKQTNLFLKNWIVYDRIKGRGAITNFVSTRQDLLWYVKDEKNYTFNNEPSKIKKKTGGSIGNKNGCQFRKLTNVWTDISPIVPWSSQRVDHPTQKPLQLMQRIIRIFTNENDVVLDMFAGSGTTGVACYNLNRKCILIEKQQQYCQIIKNRFQKLLKQKENNLF